MLKILLYQKLVSGANQLKKKLLPIEIEELHYEITWSFQVLILSYVAFQPYLFALEYMDMIPNV